MNYKPVLLLFSFILTPQFSRADNYTETINLRDGASATINFNWNASNYSSFTNISGSASGTGGYDGTFFQTYSTSTADKYQRQTTTTPGYVDAFFQGGFSIAPFSSTVFDISTAGKLLLTIANGEARLWTNGLGYPSWEGFYESCRDCSSGTAILVDNSISVSVPEPVTIVLIGAGLLCIAASRRNGFNANRRHT